MSLHINFMPKFLVHQSDKAEKEIVEGLRKLGYSVCKIGQPVDLLVGKHNNNALFEVKNPKAKGQAAGKLSDKQEEFFENWRGQVSVVTSLEEAVNTLKKIGM
jgi:hypothetical protein